MNSFTHTFKIYYLILYIGYLILWFLRSQKQDLCTQPLALERILILTQPKMVCVFWLYTACKGRWEVGQAFLQGFELIPCWKEIGHPGSTSVPLTCPQRTAHINQGPMFLLPTAASPREFQGELVQGKKQKSKIHLTCKTRKIMKHS